MRLVSQARRLSLFSATIAVAALLASHSIALAKVHALVIGINDYDHQPKLAGAVADADDIAAALRGIKANSIIQLKDHEATKRAIVETWEIVLRTAEAGDTIIFTYAGHGGQEPFTPPGKPAEKAESFLLAAFTPKGPESAERILDKEINVWLRRAGERGLRVIFVADSCHAGGMTRGVDGTRGMDGRAAVTYRSVPDYGIPDVLVSSGDLKLVASTTRDDLTHVTFFAATQADKRSPEVLIDGRKRGALSYAFARALEGAADRKGTGTLTQFELAGYITATVRQLSEAQQTPDVVYRSGSEHEALLTGIPSHAQHSATAQDVRLHIANADQTTREALGRAIVGIVMAADAASADLVWDANEKTVVSGLGDPVALAIAPARLQGVVDKWRALPAIKRMAADRSLAMTMRPNDARHPVGQEIAFESAALRFAYVTVINLAPDGGIQFLVPKQDRREDMRSLRPGGPYRLSLKVEPPLGADHLIVIASATPLDGLHRLLRAAPPTIDLPQILHDALAGQDYEVGVQGLYTTDVRGIP